MAMSFHVRAGREMVTLEACAKETWLACCASGWAAGLRGARCAPVAHLLEPVILPDNVCLSFNNVEKVK